MLLDEKHIPWVTFTGVAAAASVAAYVLDAPRHINGPSGSTVLGLGLGIAALVLMIFAAALGLRRRVPHWRLGKAQTWMRGHIWMGLLIVLLVALHSAFEVGGPLTLTLWILLLIVTVSGIMGLLLQQVVPNRLTSETSRESVAQQLGREFENIKGEAEALASVYAGDLATPAPAWSPEIQAKIDAEAREELAKAETPGDKVRAKKKVEQGPQPPAGGEPMRRFYLDHAQAYFAGQPSAQLHAPHNSQILFNSLRTMVPAHIQPGVIDLERLVDRRRELLRQRFWMRILLGWVVFHVPLSWALLALTVVHAVMALRWGW